MFSYFIFNFCIFIVMNSPHQICKRTPPKQAAQPETIIRAMINIKHGNSTYRVSQDQTGLDHSSYWSIKWYGGRGRFDTPGK